MADFKLNDILLMGDQAWSITAIDDESMEITATSPNDKGYRRVVKVMLSDTWKWGFYTIHRMDTEFKEYIPNKLIEDLLA